METHLPKQIGRYRVSRLLGTGAMGYVYLGYDPRLDRQVAIKTLRELHLDPEARERFVARFRNEARAAARLQHPCIVQVHDVDEDPEVGPYLVFEYVPGTTLHQLLKERGPLPPHVLIPMAEQVASALDAAHERGVLHRDVKPHNILVTEAGHAKLADFGVARLPDAALTREGQFLGTPAYAAPETLAHGDYSPRSDLFSFAAVLYEAITGNRPFPGEEALAVAHRVMHESPKPLAEAAKEAHVPPEVDRAIAQALDKDPQKRPERCTDLARRLREGYERAGTLSPELPGFRPDTGEVRLDPTPRRRGSPHRRGLLVWALPLALFAAGALAYVVRSAKPTPAPHPSPRQAAPPVPSVPKRTADAAPSPEPPSVGQPAIPREVAAPALGLAMPDAAPADAAPAPARPMTAHEREEAAKDALQEARSALERGDHARARSALQRARQLDPSNLDIEAVEAWLRSESP